MCLLSMREEGFRGLSKTVSLFGLVVLLSPCSPQSSFKENRLQAEIGLISDGGSRTILLSASRTECMSLCDTSRTWAQTCLHGHKCLVQSNCSTASICQCIIHLTCFREADHEIRAQEHIHLGAAYNRSRIIRDLGLYRHPIVFHFRTLFRYELNRLCRCHRDLLQTCELHKHCGTTSECHPGGCSCQLTLGCIQHKMALQMLDVHPTTVSPTQFHADTRDIFLHPNQQRVLVYETEQSVCSQVCSNHFRSGQLSCAGVLNCLSKPGNNCSGVGSCTCEITLNCLDPASESEPKLSKPTLETIGISCTTTGSKRGCQTIAPLQCEGDKTAFCASSQGQCTYLYRTHFPRDNCCFKIDCPKEDIQEILLLQSERVEGDKSLFGAANMSLSFLSGKDHCLRACEPITTSCPYGTICLADFVEQFANCSITVYCWEEDASDDEDHKSMNEAPNELSPNRKLPYNRQNVVLEEEIPGTPVM